MDPQLIPFGWGLFKDDEEVYQVKNKLGKTTLRKALGKTNWISGELFPYCPMTL